MKVINLLGGPGSGKSTTAAGLFFKMKLSNKLNRIELVTEFAKDLVYAGRFKELQHNQLYITVKQYSRLARLRSQVDYIITDSPIIQGILYTPKNYYTFFKPLITELHYSFDNLNIFINRVKNYEQYGRTQSEGESNKKSESILNFLNMNKIKYHIVDGNINAPDKIMNLL